jgi:hypothetical protein
MYKRFLRDITCGRERKEKAVGRESHQSDANL